MIDATCSSCKFYQAPRPTDSDPAADLWGRCHRYPPVVVVTGSPDYPVIDSARPECSAGGFCGEWQTDATHDQIPWA